MRAAPSLNDIFLRKSASWSVITFLITLVVAVPILILNQKIDSERQLMTLAGSTARSFRPQILSDYARDAQDQITLTLNLSDQERVVMRDQNLKAIYPMRPEDEIVECKIPMKPCWSRSLRQVTVLYPIYFDQEQSNLYGYLELTIAPAFNKTVFELLIVLLVMAFALQTIGLTTALRSTSMGLTELLTIWSVHLRRSPQNAISATHVPFTELQPMSDAMKGLHGEIEILKKRAAHRATAELQASIAKRVAHDIRSPLSALQIVSQKSRTLSEDEKSLVRLATEQINQIANNLLQTSKTIEEKPLVDLTEILHQTVLLKRQECDPSRDEIILQQSDSVIVEASPSELMRIVSNLMNNALESYKDGQKRSVTLNLNHHDGIAFVTIEDFGKGIDKLILEKLRNGLKTSTKANGSGIGIFSAMASLKDMGGYLRIDSTVGVGTSVTIELPIFANPVGAQPPDIRTQG